MIKVKVRTVWQGQVAINEKYVKEAINKEVGIVIEYKDRKMTVVYNDLRTAYKLGEETYEDRYSREKYRLAYFTWRPDKPSQGLFDLLVKRPDSEQEEQQTDNTGEGTNDNNSGKSLQSVARGEDVGSEEVSPKGTIRAVDLR